MNGDEPGRADFWPWRPDGEPGATAEARSAADHATRVEGRPALTGRGRVAIVVLAIGVAAGVGVAVFGGAVRGTPPSAPLPASAQDAAAGPPAIGPSIGGPSRLDAPLPPAAGAPSGRPANTPVIQFSLDATSIRIPALGVTARIGPAPVTNGILTPPRVPDEVGMWSGSAPLDATGGEVTLAGHVNWAGMAPFAFGRLAYLRPGDLVYTTDGADRQSAWRVTTVLARPKNQPIDARAFAGPSGPRRLSLITCGGSFDTHDSSYDDNIYVTAVPA